MITTQHKKIHGQDKGRGVLCLPGLLLMAVTVLILSACATVGPGYVSPDPKAPAAWNTKLKDGLKAQAIDYETLAQWWNTLKDPVLTDLVVQSVKGNLDLKLARAKVRESRARRGLSRADQYPSLDVSGSATNRRSSANSGTGRETDLYKAGFDAGWEIDIFGGVRRSVEAADADLAASEESLRDVLVSLTAETVRNYVEARMYQTRLAVAEANLKAQEKTYELIVSRFEAGLSDELAVQQARYNLEDTRSWIPPLRTGLEGAKNRLAVLTGRSPGALHALLDPRAPIPVTPPTVAVGVPAETVRQRPDIRKSERELAAQTARIGIATADLYPKFRLAGSIGLESLESANFFESASRFWGIGPSVSWKIFHAGAIRKNIEVQSALQEQYVIAYEAAVLGALEEVENALTAYAEEQLRRERLLSAVGAARRAEELSQDQYQAGLVDFSNVLDAQRSLLSLEDQLAQSDGSITNNLVSLYKALGGGWQPMGNQGQ